MRFILKGSLGDHAGYTGIPEAYHRLTGERLDVVSPFLELWESNPFVSNKGAKDGKVFHLDFEQSEVEWSTYRPIRVFHQMTDVIAAPSDVAPKLYKKFKKVKNRITICTQAGWPSRRGYLYWNHLIDTLDFLGCEVISIFNPNFRDCTGQNTKKEYQTEACIDANPTLREMIDLIGSSELFIGYDSGPTHVAASCGTPQMIFGGSVAPAVYVHPNCLNVFSHCGTKHCHMEICRWSCLERMPNVTDEIAMEVKEFLFAH